MKKFVLILISVIVVLYFLLTMIAPDIVEKQQNPIAVKGPYTVTDSVQVFYDSLSFIGDLHCDALLWDRDLTKLEDFGQVDFPRMQQANIAVEAFTIVTKSPAGQNFEENSADAFDNITLLNFAQGRPLSNWFSLFKRAKYQSEKLQDLADDYGDKFSVIRTRSDLETLISKRASDPSYTGGFLGVEGAHALQGDLENVDRLFDLGIRMMAPTHFFDNELGGSAHGISGEGLTEFGEQVIDRMNELEMIVDLAHISPQMIDDILARTNRPVIVSHTGVDGVYDSPRNLSDEHIQAIAENGGLIGIAFFPGAVGEGGTPAIVQSMKHVRDLVGIEHIALGSDYDGSVLVPFDITGLPLLVEEMFRQDFTRDEIRAVMGENMKRFLLENLPE